MEGIIVDLNYNRDVYSVLLPNGTYSIFELLDTKEIEKMDTIEGDLDLAGPCVLENLTSDYTFDATVHFVGLDLQSAYNLTFLK